MSGAELQLILNELDLLMEHNIEQGGTGDRMLIQTGKAKKTALSSSS